MTKRDIEGLCAALNAQAQAQDGVVAISTGIQLLSGLLVDINRIADALEAIALNTTPGPR